MSSTLFFYDLETSGLRPDSARIMQFAGQRVDSDLNPAGEPLNYLIRLNEDILPDPDAVLVHGITPQQTITEGLSESEFLSEFYSHVALPETTFVGFNNIRFDDEFMRYLNYRNLYDPFAWSWEHNSSRWDLLDVTRMTRALRPEGINWPNKAGSGEPINRLEELSRANKLPHVSAHDALSDVSATLALARLIKKNQPKLYNYLFKMRLKDQASKLISSREPFIYTSSHYPSLWLHTTIVVKVANHPGPNASLVYDLRFDPTPWINKSAKQLADSWRFIKDRGEDDPPLPVKTIKYNRCPAIAPLSVMLDKQTPIRLGLEMDKINKHLAILQAKPGKHFAQELLKALDILDSEQRQDQQKRRLSPDMQLYQSFYSDKDRSLIKEMHLQESAEQVRRFRERFTDPRLKSLCSLYIARNFKSQLNDTERKGWEEYLNKRLFFGNENSRLSMYFQRIDQLSESHPNTHDQVLLEDLKLYGESLLPSSYSWE